MDVKTTYLTVTTSGNGDIQDLTQAVEDSLTNSQVLNGLATLFTASATSGLSTLEYEPGCIEDLKRLFDEILPADRDYLHNLRWGDGNGHSHIRAALLKPSLTIPVVEGKLTLGTWQSIILVDFDNRPRKRELILQILGE